MKIIKIKSANADFQKFEVLKANRNKRYRYSEFFVEGVRNINEALKYPEVWKIISFIFSSDIPLSDWAKNILANVKTSVNYELPTEMMEELSGKEKMSELAAIVKMKEEIGGADQIVKSMPSSPVAVVFDRPSNKGNLGTVIRSCDAFGIDILVVTGHSVDLYDPEVISSTTGSFFKTNIIRLEEKEKIQEFFSEMKSAYRNLQIIGTTAHSENAVYDVDLILPTILILGNEKEGMNKFYSGICDKTVTIPMDAECSASSLNVACAATVLFYETRRQRNFY